MGLMNLILKPLRYVFYRILTWKMRDPRETTPVLVAGIGTSVLLFFNCMLAVMVVNALRGRPLLPQGRIGNGVYLAVALALIVTTGLMNAAWIDKGNFARLSKEFSSQQTEHRRVRTLLFWAYVVLSGATPIVLAIAWHARQAR